MDTCDYQHDSGKPIKCVGMQPGTESSIDYGQRILRNHVLGNRTKYPGSDDQQEEDYGQVESGRPPGGKAGFNKFSQ